MQPLVMLEHRPSTVLFISGERKENKELCFEEIAKGKYAGTHVCLTMKTMYLNFLCFTLFKMTLKKTIAFGTDLKTMSCAIFSSFGSSFVTFLVCKGTNKIMSLFLGEFYIK